MSDEPVRWGPKMDIVDSSTGVTATIDIINGRWEIVHIGFPLNISEEDIKRMDENARKFFSIPE